MGYYWFRIRLWCRTRPEKIAWWLAWKLPRRVALYAFVRVYGVLGECGPDYEPVYTRFVRGEGK